MYILTFKRSRSKYFEKGLNLALSLGGSWDGKQVTLEIPDDRLLGAYEILMPLFAIIQNWSSTRATYMGNQVEPYPFILYMHFLKECASKSTRSPKNCWLNIDCQDWTCKYLSNILYLESGDSNYEYIEHYWYNFGHFNSKNEWVIDKERIYKRLIQFAETKGINACPHFNVNVVRKSVDGLRSKIIIDDINYRVYFTDFYDKGEKLKFPENIRHVSQKYKDSDIPGRMKYDVSKIQIIHHHRKRDLPDMDMPSVSNPPVKYHLRVYDNYHYGDESEAYDHGEYDTYEKAEMAARAIVDEFLVHNWERGRSPDALLALYALNGEDPVVLPADKPEGKRFSASDYAEEIAESICQRLEKEQKETEVQSYYQEAIKFATSRHEEKHQKVKGTDLPYVVHLSNVAMEILMAGQQTRDFNLVFAIQVALLHDTIEDTSTTYDEIKVSFGEDVADAVKALSKDESLPKDRQIKDSLSRIKKLPSEVWAVKLADRITNLQPPPGDWSEEKISSYAEDARIILEELGGGNLYLANRLKAKIAEYKNWNK